MTLIIGVTGGIGAGKTAVTDEFEKLGIEVVDADVIARQVVEPNTPALKKIVDTFGEDIIDAAGHLRRAKLRELIFSDQNAKQKLNSIMHPAIRERLLDELTHATSPYVILSAPLLLENNLQQLVSRVLVVDVDENTQMTRASQRDGVTKSQISAIIKSQISRENRLASADDILDNSGDKQHIAEKVQAFHAKYMQILADN